MHHLHWAPTELSIKLWSQESRGSFLILAGILPLPAGKHLQLMNFYSDDSFYWLTESQHGGARRPSSSVTWEFLRNMSRQSSWLRIKSLDVFTSLGLRSALPYVYYLALASPVLVGVENDVTVSSIELATDRRVNGNLVGSLNAPDLSKATTQDTWSVNVK